HGEIDLPIAVQIGGGDRDGARGGGGQGPVGEDAGALVEEHPHHRVVVAGDGEVGLAIAVEIGGGDGVGGRHGRVGHRGGEGRAARVEQRAHGARAGEAGLGLTVADGEVDLPVAVQIGGGDPREGEGRGGGGVDGVGDQGPVAAAEEHGQLLRIARDGEVG